MTFTKRIATLAAVVAIPLGIAATSQILAGGQEKPDVPQRVRLDGGTATPAPATPGTGTPSPGATPSPSPSKTGGDEVVPGPSPRGGGDDDDDRGGDDGGDD
ncbi:MAG: hypothetical protein ACRDUA_24750 [Micromonosporaceae bacterium]